MTHFRYQAAETATTLVRRGRFIPRARWAVVVTALVVALTGCSSPAVSEPAESSEVANEVATAESESATSPEADSTSKPVDDGDQAETCDWDSPKISGSGDIPEGRTGDLPEVLVGSWQHTHTDEGAGFEAVTNDHRYVLSSPDRMLYCQHVPGATEHAENAADVTLNGATIELPGGKYGYTVTAWDEDTMVWDNPVGGGYLYLLERR